MQRAFFTATQFIFTAVITIATLSVPIVRHKIDQETQTSQEVEEKVTLSQESDLQESASPKTHKFLEDNCYKCHDEDVQKGDLQLDDKLWEFTDEKSFDFWKKVYYAVKDDRMPPKKKPAHESVQVFLDELEFELAQAEETLKKENGRTVVRRLTRREFENNIKDLFGMPYLNVARFLPEDGTYHGFHKNHESLDFSSVHLSNYMTAVGSVLDSATVAGPEPEAKKINDKFIFHGDKEQYHAGVVQENGDTWLYTNGFAGHCRPAALSNKVKHAGFYTVKFKAKAVKTTQPYILKFFSDATTLVQSDWQHFKFYDVDSDTWQSHEEKVWLEADSTICFSVPEAKHTRSGARILEQPAIAMKDIIVEGPFYDEWPLKRHELIWGDVKFKAAGKKRGVIQYLPQRTGQPEVLAYQLIKDFVGKAYSGKVAEEEFNIYAALFNSRLKETNNFRASLFTVYKAILCSPTSLYKIETKGNLDQFQLAARLSYFLWNSQPDSELLEVAEKGSLEGEILSQQVERLLNDNRSKRFVGDLTDQWLNLKDIDVTMPDPRLYPEATKPLVLAMLGETNAFVSELISKDMSLENIVDSDFAMLNSRLAKHYGIDGVDGMEMRRVKLPENHERGGLITQASILKVTANGTVTSPITRGVWFLESIMGTPLPTPPDAVPAFEPEATGKTSLREGLAEHRSNSSCAGCHRKIDPPGFAFESFDPIGGFRSKYRVYKGKRSYRPGSKVENSDVMTDGSTFKTIQEFKTLVMKDKVLVVENFLNKLTTYATGKSLTFSDQAEVDKIMAKAATKDYGARTLIHELVQSKIFRSK